MSVTLRPARQDDERFLFEVYASTRADEMARVDWAPAQKEAFLWLQFDAQRKHYNAHYPGVQWQIIQLDGAPIGRLVICRFEKELRLMDIALLPERRNAGIGTALVHDVMAEAARMGVPVVLHVETWNPALHLYRRLGFEKVADVGIYARLEWDPAGKSSSPKEHEGRRTQ